MGLVPEGGCIPNPSSAVLEADAIAAAGGVARDVVERAADRAGAALDAVAEADQVLLLLLVPLVDARRAEVVAVLAGALLEADVLVDDLDVRLPGVFVELVGEELVGQLLHVRTLRTVPRSGTSAGRC